MCFILSVPISSVQKETILFFQSENSLNELLKLRLEEMKRARSRTPSPLPALQPLSFSPLREYSRSPTPLQRECKWMRHGISRSISRTNNNSNNTKVVQNEDKELMLALQRLHDKLQVSEPAYFDEDVAIIPFPSESNSSLSRSPHRTSESEDALSSSNFVNNNITESNNSSPSKNFITNEVYEFAGTGNVSTIEGTTRNGKVCEFTLKSTRRNVNHNKINNVCSVTSSLLLTSVNLLDASQITRHRRAATNALNMIKQAYALVTIECNQKESIREKITVIEEELDSVNKNIDECLHSSRNVCFIMEEVLEQQNRGKEDWNAYLSLCLQQQTCHNSSYASWLVCKLHACVQSLLVYANASLPLRFAISSDARVLLMLCDIGSCALQLTNQHQKCINNIISMNGINHDPLVRNVQMELEQLRVHWIECGLSSRLLNYLEQAYVLEFLLDAALPPAVCSTRYEGMHTALLNTKQKIINEFATNRITNNLLTNISSSNNNTNVSTDATNNIPAVMKNNNNTNNRAVSVSLTRVCKCFPLRALCALITMSAFADVKVRVRLLDKLTSEGLLERILQEMHRAIDELHMLIMSEENKLNGCKTQYRELVQNVKKDNLTFSRQEESTPEIVESTEGKENNIKNKKVTQSKYQRESKNISHCRSQSVPLEHERCDKELTDTNIMNMKKENQCSFTTLNNNKSTERHVAHSLSPRPKMHYHSSLANKESKKSKCNMLCNEKGFHKEKDNLTSTEMLENNTHCATILPVKLSRQPLSQIHEQIGNCVDVLLLLSCANLRPACEADELASNAKTASMAVIRPCEWLMHMTEIKAIVHTLVHVLTLYSSLPVILQSSYGGGSSEILQIVECLHQMLNVNECVAKIVEQEIEELIAHRQEHDNIFDSNKTRMESEELIEANSFTLLSILLPLISQIITVMENTSTKLADCVSCINDTYTRHTKWFATLSYYLPLEIEVERNELTRTRHSTIRWGTQWRNTVTPHKTLNKRNSEKSTTESTSLNGMQKEWLLECWWELHEHHNELHKCTRRISRRELCVMNEYFDFARHVAPIMQSILEQEMEECEQKECCIKNSCNSDNSKNNNDELPNITHKKEQYHEKLEVSTRENICHRVQCVYVFCSKVSAIASVVLSTAHKRQNNLFSAKAANCLYVLTPILERMKKQMNAWQDTVETNVSVFVCTPCKVEIGSTSGTAAKLTSSTGDGKIHKVYTPEMALAVHTSETSPYTTSDEKGNRNDNTSSLSPFINSPTTSLHFEAALSRSNSEETVGDVLGLTEGDDKESKANLENIKYSVNNNKSEANLKNTKNSVEIEYKEQIEEEEEEEISPQTVTRSWRERFSFHNLFMTRSSTTLLTPTQTLTSCNSNRKNGTK